MIKTKIFKNKQTRLVCFKVKNDSKDYRVHWDRKVDIVSLYNYDETNGYEQICNLPTYMTHIWKVDKDKIVKDVAQKVIDLTKEQTNE